MYVGISPFNGPNIYTLIPVVSQLYGLWYLKGGMYSFIKALIKVIEELGGTITTGVTVEEILFLKGKAIGVKTSEGIEKGDIIVCNSGTIIVKCKNTYRESRKKILARKYFIRNKGEKYE